MSTPASVVSPFIYPTQRCKVFAAILLKHLMVMAIILAYPVQMAVPRVINTAFACWVNQAR